MNNIYKYDWFTRDDNYTVSNKDIKLGWESIVGTQYSKYLYSNSIVSALLGNNVELVCELSHINKMLGLDNQVIIDNKGLDSYTDGKTIVISPFYAKTAETNYDKMDVLIGLLAHESSHCLYTDFNYLEYHKANITKLIHTISNIIEDELIETKLGQEYPGYINFISKVKYYYFGKFEKSLKTTKAVNELDEIIELFLYIVRYPKHIPEIDTKKLNKYEDLFIKIHNILKICDCFDLESKQSCTIRSVNAAIKIVELLKDYIDKQPEEKKDAEGDSGKFAQQEIECNKPGSKKSKIDELGDVIDAKNHSSNENDSNNTIKKIIEENDWKKYITGGSKLGLGEKRKSRVVKYNELLAKVKEYIEYTKNLIIPNEYKEVLKTVNYRRNGNLDPNRLADAMQNNSQVFQQRLSERVKKETARYALCLILDESGSMSGIHDIVTSFAIMIYEALSKYPGIELYIYGYGDVVNTYIDKYNRDKYVLGNCQMQFDQNEFETYKIIIDSIKKQTRLPIVCISFTDSCYCTDIPAFEKLFKDYKKQNVSFNLACIDGSDGIFTSEDDSAGWNSITEVNNKLYGENNWVVVGSNILNKGMKPLIDKLAKIIKNNYDKYNKM